MKDNFIVILQITICLLLEFICNFIVTYFVNAIILIAENPVVQGMFIVKELCDKAQTDEIEVKYIHPVYGCNPVYIKQEGNILKGFSNGILCFQATLS